VKLRNT